MTETIYSRGDNPDMVSGPAPRVATLMSMAQEILVRLNAVAAGAGVTLPDRQLVYPGAVPADCEQVTVLIGGWTAEPAAEGMLNCLTLRWCAQMGVLISRCTPAVPLRNTSTAPPAARMLEAAQISSADAELLLALVGTFGEVGAEIQLATPEPEGGFQAVLLNVTLPAFGGLD